MLAPVALARIFPRMKIHFFTGKGGVGKTTVSWMFAHELARSGQKTLFIETSEESLLPDLGLADSPSTFVPKEIPSQRQNGNQWKLQQLPKGQPEQLLPGPRHERSLGRSPERSLWRGQDCLREYAHHLLKISPLVDLLFDHKITQSLIQVAPAVFELALLGKITSGPPRLVGPPLDYDALVVDAYASGHFLSLLRSPQGMAKAIRFGPMGKQSRAIHEMLINPEYTQYHLVSLLEDLPVEESLELGSTLKNEFDAKPHLWINRVLQLDPEQMEELARFPNLNLSKVLHERLQFETKFRTQLLDFPSWADVREVPEFFAPQTSQDTGGQADRPRDLK